MVSDVSAASEEDMSKKMEIIGPSDIIASNPYQNEPERIRTRKDPKQRGQVKTRIRQEGSQTTLARRIVMNYRCLLKAGNPLPPLKTHLRNVFGTAPEALSMIVLARF